MTAPSVPALRVIEPGLTGHSGHYAEFVRALAARNTGTFRSILVHGGVNADAVLADVPGVEVISTGLHDGAALRLVLQQDDPFLLLTARPAHAPLLAWLGGMGGRASRERLRQARLYFHWPDRGAGARLLMAAAPNVRRNVTCIAPTQATVEHLRRYGWTRVAHVPYPVVAPAQPPAPHPFRHLLMAGAARMNKGLDLVAGLAERMGARGDRTPLLVQTTPKRRSGRRGRAEEPALARLLASGAPGLIANDTAPLRDAYVARFSGALVLAPYDPAVFAHNVSGVVLDALLHGAPVVASAGSWPGSMVERFQAGALLRERTPQALDDAIQRVLAQWDRMTANAQNAARTLAAEHDPAHLVRLLREGV